MKLKSGATVLKFSEKILRSVKYTDFYYWNASTLNNYTKKVFKNYYRSFSKSIF